MKPVGWLMPLCWTTTMKAPSKTSHGSSHSLTPTLWQCKASSVNAAPAITGCAPTPDRLPVLLCSTAMWWAQPGYSAATTLEGRKAIQSKEVWARGKRGNLSTSPGNSNCPVSLMLPPLWFSVCFLCVLKQPRVNCLPLKSALCFCSIRSSYWAWSSSRVQGTFNGGWCCQLLTREPLNCLFMPQLSWLKWEYILSYLGVLEKRLGRQLLICDLLP